MRIRRQRMRWAAVAAVAVTASLLPAYASALPNDPGGESISAAGEQRADDEPDGKKSPAATPDVETGGPDAPSKVEQPDSKLPKGWRTSDDRAVTVVGDAQGLHLLVAASATAYQWQEAATLREDGFDTDAWIGNVCVTGSGKRAVVTYAPRAFTNEAALFDRGAFAAVVDLDTRKVTKLRDQVSLAYFNPGCGAGETAVLTQSGDEQVGETRLLRLNTVTGKVTRTLTVKGEATSAVPVGDETVAAFGNRLTRVAADGRTELIARTSGPAFRLHPDSAGGVGFLDLKGEKVTVRRAVGDRLTTLAHGEAGKVGLSAGTGGRLFLTGTPQDVAPLPSGVKRLVADAGTTVSSHGRLVVDKAVSAGLRTHVADPLAARADEGHVPYRIEASIPQSDEELEFTVPGETAPAAEKQSPALKGAVRSSSAGKQGAAEAVQPRTAAAGALAVDSSTTTYDPEATCAVPRNDPSQQALQPTPNQVEWAADMAVRGNLTSGYLQQGGWRSQAGLGSSVSPSTMFPLPALKDAPAGARIPAQVLLGVLAQESNLWQATHHVLPGQTGNPLVGNFYGTNIYPGTPGYDPDKYWTVNWGKADCGYGMGQQTDGMSAQPDKPAPFPAAQQRAIALDYAANVAVAAQTLAKKWNELHTDGQRVEINDDDPQNIENWFAAVWNYNLGFNTPDSAGKWGLGWLNNPANPKYPADRNAFLDNNSYADAAKPQLWPYPEKVMGWAAFPIDTGRAYSDSGVEDDSNTHGYQPAWWNSTLLRTQAIKPPLYAFCNDANDCSPVEPPVCTTEACYGDHWYDDNARWTDCSGTCGFETLTYKTLRVEPGRGNSGAPACTLDGLPSNALVIDDVAPGVPSMRSDCSKSWTSSGSLTWKFAENNTTYEGKEDFQQVGGGFGSHFWFAHSRDSAHRSTEMGITGTWTLNKSLNQWARVLVHLPDTGAHTQQAHYRIHTADGVRDRYINTRHRKNTWVALGVYRFDGIPQVVLDNETDDGTADEDIAWDAVAVQPLAAKPQHMVVAMGDSYTSGEGAGDYYEATNLHWGKDTWNGCRRSENAWPRKVTLPGQSQTVATLADGNDPSLDFQFTACSGAKTWQVSGYPNGWGQDGNFHEKVQTESGALSDDTTLVMLTIGGNDVRFDQKLQECATTWCPSEDSMKSDIDAAITETRNTLTSIESEARNATIMLMGYPALFSNNLDCTALLTPTQGEIINRMAQYFEDKQKALATEMHALGVTFKSPQAAFEGKRVCDDPEGINGIVAGPNGEGDFGHGDGPSVCVWPWGGTCLSRESYHPNKLGTTAYAQAFMTQGP
ncbi:GDSL-type esterase/lipase family protein [Streptomyces sp. NBC_00234]|uniref:golvesin C-terminal-like domain-containing protein n=1 Tax=Streptomyces sp. NBC_00234 TaxID=2903638 RepID=UPI002E2AE098|nr:SGNH/GDSL hydrolase family protein [Streptomyces sp. NBC_00234]